ncbi:unnamed protein product [Orchesella dallaii]|uniref:BEN domain-containing protein n=1 Tax=Orchesella dallaii TaxID=48710 RepID=A0ABP1QKN7_9HEXA
MKYFVVRWCAENNQFSVIRENNILDGTVRANPDVALGKEVKVSWKNEEYEAVLLAFGNKKEMDKCCDELAEEAFEQDIGQPIQQSSTSSNLQLTTPTYGARTKKKRRRLENVLSRIATAEELPPADDPPVHLTDWQSLYNLEKEKSEALELKLGRLKGYIKLHMLVSNFFILDLNAYFNGLQKVFFNFLTTIADGVHVERGALSTAKLMSTGPATLARNLFRIVFTKEELYGKSLLGKMCNANKNTNQLPSIDSVRRDAVIMYCLSAYGHTSDPTKGKEALMQYRCMKKDVIASLSKYLREVNKSRSGSLAENVSLPVNHADTV